MRKKIIYCHQQIKNVYLPINSTDLQFCSSSEGSNLLHREISSVWEVRSDPQKIAAQRREFFTYWLILINKFFTHRSNIYDTTIHRKRSLSIGGPKISVCFTDRSMSKNTNSSLFTTHCNPVQEQVFLLWELHLPCI